MGLHAQNSSGNMMYHLSCALCNRRGHFDSSCNCPVCYTHHQVMCNVYQRSNEEFCTSMSLLFQPFRSRGALSNAVLSIDCSLKESRSIPRIGVSSMQSKASQPREKLPIRDGDHGRQSWFTLPGTSLYGPKLCAV